MALPPERDLCLKNGERRSFSFPGHLLGHVGNGDEKPHCEDTHQEIRKFTLALNWLCPTTRLAHFCYKKRSYCCIFLVSQAKMRPFKPSIGFCKKEMVGIETGLYKHQHNRIFYPNYPLSPLVWENMKQFNEVTVMP